MGSRAIEVNPGDIFMIPLFLPPPPWRWIDVDYRKYKFHMDDIYAFGRLIEKQAGNVALVEVFSYSGQIPENPEIIIRSGRMFAPDHIGYSFFKTGRWRVLFHNPQYDMWKDSDYENISFLSDVGHMWKGKEEIRITKEELDELKEAGVPYWVMHDYVDLEERIRFELEKQGIALNYQQIVRDRESEYPKPRDPDKKLKETIAPFCWLSRPGQYVLSLDAGLLNADCFEKNNMSGNGYEWEKVASAFIERQGIDAYRKFSFDCEADTFTMYSSSKKSLKEFALSFHSFVMNSSAFEEFIMANNMDGISLPNEFMNIEFFQKKDFSQKIFNGQTYEIIGKDDVENFVGVSSDKQVFLLNSSDNIRVYISKSVKVFLEEIKAYHQYSQIPFPDNPSEDELQKHADVFRELLTKIDENACLDESAYWSCIVEEMGYGII